MPMARSGEVGIHYEDGGAGEPVVLVPGLGMATPVWADARRRLEPTCRVLTVDPRGSGQSGKPAGPYTGDTVAGDLEAVLDDAGVDAAHVVGMSMGGLVAQSLAVRRPERVRSLVLVSTYAVADEWLRRALGFRRRVIEEMGFSAQFELAVLFVFSPKALRTIPDFVHGLEERIAANPPDEAAYRAQLDFCLAHDETAALPGVRVPTLVVSGAEDALTSRFAGRDLAGLVPGAVYREVPEASHGMVWEEPELFASLVAEHVAGVV
ncbi:MAG: alpha/beta fold hydrolase [Actinobacteria bacterium]|nr:alpha/beta fold hydrolase [Actinomycetota bacterium]